MLLTCMMALLLLPQSDSFHIPNCAFLDLTQALDKNMPISPDTKEFEFTILHRGPDPPNKWLEYNTLSMHEHTGTHLDAPSHFFEGGHRIDQVPLKSLVGEGCVVDISEKVKADPDYVVSIADFTEWEEKHGKIAKDALVLIHTGYDKYWNNSEKYLGTSAIDDASSFHYPGLSAESATWLVQNRKPRAVGIDCLSLDPGQHPATKPAHVAILSHKIPAAENLKNLGQLPPRGSTVFLAAMKIRGGSGGPIRAFAIGWNGPNDPCKIKNTADKVINNGSFILSITLYMLAYLDV